MTETTTLDDTSIYYLGAALLGGWVWYTEEPVVH